MSEVKPMTTAQMATTPKNLTEPAGLILNRAPGERIFVGANIIVTFLGVDERGNGRIGVIAPPNVTVDREEIAMQRAQGFQPRGR